MYYVYALPNNLRDLSPGIDNYYDEEDIERIMYLYTLGT